MKSMNLIEANAILVDIAHLALQKGLFTSFEQVGQVGVAVAVAREFVELTATNPKENDFTPKAQTDLENTKGFDNGVSNNHEDETKKFNDEILDKFPHAHDVGQPDLTGEIKAKHQFEK